MFEFVSSEVDENMAITCEVCCCDTATVTVQVKLQNTFEDRQALEEWMAKGGFNTPDVVLVRCPDCLGSDTHTPGYKDVETHKAEGFSPDRPGGGNKDWKEGGGF